MNNRNNNLMHYLVGPKLFNDKNELRKKVVNEFNKCLFKMDITTKLIIIDPYFFSSSTNEDKDQKIEKSEFFISLLHPCLKDLKNLIITTGSNIDQEFKEIFINDIKFINSSIEFKLNQNNSFHDRFVFNPLLVKGVSMGASFNGLLKKINTFDNMSQEDATVFEKLLKAEKLL